MKKNPLCLKFSILSKIIKILDVQALLSIFTPDPDTIIEMRCQLNIKGANNGGFGPLLLTKNLNPLLMWPWVKETISHLYTY